MITLNERFMKKGMEELRCSKQVIEALEINRLEGARPECFASEPFFANFYKRYLMICEKEKIKNFIKEIFTVTEVGDTGLYITDVIFNDPATIVKWADGTKTVVKCGKHDEYDREKGLAMAIIKKMCGNTGNFNEIFKVCGCYPREVPVEMPEESVEKPAEELKEEAKMKKFVVKKASKTPKKKKTEKK